MDREELLKEEYFQLQKTIEDFDGRTLTIKAWSVTFSATGLGLAYELSRPELLLVAAASAWVFWLIEAAWKVHQRAFYRRVDQIEDWFGGRKLSSPPEEGKKPKDGEPKAGPPAPLQILNQWRASYRGESWWELWVKPSFGLGVLLPHFLVTAAGIYLYFSKAPDPAATAKPPVAADDRA